MVKEQYVSFETAKLAKEKRFNEHCNHYYDSDRKLNYHDQYISNSSLNKLYDLQCYLAPTQSLLARWLREKRYIFLSIDIKPNLGFVYGIKCFDRDFLGHTNFSQFSYATYEEAMEAGLQEALKLI